MTKKINTDKIVNELSASSLFFQRPTVKERRHAAESTDVTPNARTGERANNHQDQTTVRSSDQSKLPPSERPNGRTPERENGKRIITRNSFEIFEDQMDALRERSYQDKRAGKIGSMSAMVRDAIDQYLADK